MSSCRTRDIPTTGGVGDGGTGCIEGWPDLGDGGGGCIEGIPGG